MQSSNKFRIWQFSLWSQDFIPEFQALIWSLSVLHQKSSINFHEIMPTYYTVVNESKMMLLCVIYQITLYIYCCIEEARILTNYKPWRGVRWNEGNKGKGRISIKPKHRLTWLKLIQYVLEIIQHAEHIITTIKLLKGIIHLSKNLYQLYKIYLFSLITSASFSFTDAGDSSKSYEKRWKGVCGT